MLKAAQFLISLSIHLTAEKKNDSRFRHRFTRFLFGPSGHHFAHFCPLCTCAPPAAIHWTVVYIGRRYNCIWFRYFIRVGVGDLGNFFFFLSVTIASQRLHWVTRNRNYSLGFNWEKKNWGIFGVFSGSRWKIADVGAVWGFCALKCNEADGRNR